MKRRIKRQKRLHRNIFHLPLTKDQWFQYALFILGMSAIMDVLKRAVGDANLAIIAVLLMAFGVLLVQGILEKSAIIPYGPEKQFIGLYSIEENKKIELNNDNGLIPRHREVDCLKKLIETCFMDTENRRGICILGRSGSGKSTIINQFEYQESHPYVIQNFSDSYDYFEEYVLDLYKNDPGYNLTEKKELFLFWIILNVFFSLTDARKMKIKKTIKRMAKLPVVFVFSMREEFFVPFVQEFDINNLASDDQAVKKNAGILFYKEYLSGSREKTEENILICGSERREGKDLTVNQTMGRLCQQAFGERRGEEVYSHFQDSTLIQQQIIFNMMKHDYDRDGEIPLLDSNVDESLMMKQYYDVQLCSTGDYFMASRILYLLCLGRNSEIAFTDEDIRNALCVFDKRDVYDFKTCLGKLHDLNLVKYSAHNSTVRYEIAHDYIAKSYEAYANTEIPANVKSALDEFKSEYVRRTNMNDAISDYRRKKKWIQSGIFGGIVFAVAMMISLASFVYNVKSRSGRLPWTVFTLCMASLVYVYGFYMNITRHYRKAAWVLVCLFYLVAMCLGTTASVFPQYWLHCLGAGNASLGLSCVIIGVNSHLAESAHQWFLTYGVKTFVVGVLLLGLAFITQFGTFQIVWMIDTKSVLQFVPMVALLIYAYLAHLNKEFFYVGVEGIFSGGRA